VKTVEERRKGIREKEKGDEGTFSDGEERRTKVEVWKR
jgi:hypothetical protein